MEILKRIFAGLFYWSKKIWFLLIPHIAKYGKRTTASITSLLHFLIIGNHGGIFQAFRVVFLFLIIRHVIWPHLSQQNISFVELPILFFIYIFIFDFGIRIGVPIALTLMGLQIDAENKKYRREDDHY